MTRRMLMLPPDDERGASTRYRVLAHLPALSEAGYRADVRYPHRGRFPAAWRLADLVRDVFPRPVPELLFIHRKMYPPWFAGRLRRLPLTRVFDMDDALDLPPPSRSLDPAARERYRRNFEATAGAMDLVLCGNADLAERVPHDRCELLPTAIDTRRFAPTVLPRAGPPRTLGWVGHSDNLIYLEALADPLRELARRHPGLRLVVVADRAPRLAGVEVEFREWSLEREVSCFDGIDVGLMPLEDTPWARGKCAFKAIQYMALGIPAVASPVGMNREVIRDGESGFLPGAPADWVAALDRLLSDTALAQKVGAAGRRVVEERYALDVVSRRLVTILESLPSGSSSRSAAHSSA